MAPIVCGGWDAYHRRICTSDESFLLLLDNDIDLPPFGGFLIYSGDRDEIMCNEKSTIKSYVLKQSYFISMRLDLRRHLRACGFEYVEYIWGSHPYQLPIP